MKNKSIFESKNKMQLLIIAIVIFFSKNGFYLWETNDYLMPNLFKYSDFAVVFILLWNFWVLVSCNSSSKLRLYRYSKYIIVFLLLTLVSAVVADFYYGQSIFRGISAQRLQIVYLLAFFPIVSLVRNNRVSANDIIKLLYTFAIYELIICTLQYFLAGNIIFLSVNSGTRYNSVRLYFEASLVSLVAYRCLTKLLNGENKVFNTIYICWTLFYYLQIVKMRALSICFILTCLVYIVLIRKDIVKKIGIYLLVAIIGIVIFNNSDLVQDLTTSLFDISGDANLVYREYGRKLYWNGFIKSPLFGQGYPSISSDAAQIAVGGYDSVFFSDNGIFGFLYSYGLCGFLWYICFWLKILRDSWKIRKINYSYFLFLFANTINPITDFSWFWSGTFTLTLTICLLSDSYYNRSKGEIYEYEK